MLSQNEELRRNEDLKELRLVLGAVKDQLDNQNPVPQKPVPVPKGNFLLKNSSEINKQIFSVPPRKEGPLSFQNPSFAHPGRDDPELIPVNLNNHGTSESRRHLFDELENEGKCCKSIGLLTHLIEKNPRC